jgi:hypothetical protein
MLSKIDLQSAIATLTPEQVGQVAQFITSIQTPKSPRPKGNLTRFYGVFRNSAPYPGRDAIREQVAAAMADRHASTESIVISF